MTNKIRIPFLFCSFHAQPFWSFVYLTLFSILSQSLPAQEKKLQKDSVLLEEETKTYLLKKSTAEVFSKAKLLYKDPIRLDDQKEVSVIPGSVTINATNGIRHTFSNYSDTLYDLETKTYKYAGYYPIPGFYMIEGEYYESAGFILVDKKTGRLDSMWSQPYPSPDTRLLLNYYADGRFMPEPYGAICITQKGNVLEKVVHLEPGNWYPDEVYWIDNRKLAISAIKTGDAQPMERIYFTLTLKH